MTRCAELFNLPGTELRDKSGTPRRSSVYGK
jgi:hypothetical protein